MRHKKSCPLSRAYSLLEPGPVVLLTTAGPVRPNIMVMSWHTMMEFEPPLVGCVISARNHSFDLLTAAGTCAINIPTREIADKVVGCGNTSGRDTDKFAAFGLTAESAAAVDAPLIGECYASLECRLADSRLVANHNFFILEVHKAWVDPAVDNPKTLHHRGYGKFMVAGEVIELPSRMR